MTCGGRFDPLENVSLRYDNNTDVLQDINFELKPDRFTFLPVLQAQVKHPFR